jgi:hypothetical protein
VTDPLVEARIGRANGIEEHANRRSEYPRGAKKREKPEAGTASTRRWGKKRRANGAKERGHPSDGKTSARRLTVVPGDATFSGQDISGSSDEERKTVAGRLFQRHSREEFIRTRPTPPPTDFFWGSSPPRQKKPDGEKRGRR